MLGSRVCSRKQKIPKFSSAKAARFHLAKAVVFGTLIHESFFPFREFWSSVLLK